MVVAVQEHDVKWLAPTPVWSRDRFGTDNYRNGAFNKPAILRFDNDEFMEELMSMIAFDPDRMPEWLAVEETWREPMRKPPAVSTLQRAEPISRLSKRLQRLSIEQKSGGNLPAVPVPAQPPVTLNADLPFKLYQPVQQRYYLVAASLVCRNAGLPDRTVDSGKQEQVRFVVRRVAPNDENQTDPPDLSGSDFTEYAFVTTEFGFQWKQVDPENALELETDEERLPLFAVSFDHNKQKRRMLSGLVPVGRREAYLAAPRHEDLQNPIDFGEGIVGPTTSLGVLFQSEVVDPWKTLEEMAFTAETSLKPEANGLPTDVGAARSNAEEALKVIREQIQTASWYVLLDLAKFLRDRLPRIWDALNGRPVDPPLDPENESLLRSILATISQTSSLRTELAADSGSHFNATPTTLVAALNKALESEDDLESIDLDLDIGSDTADNEDDEGNQWPKFLFPLSHPRLRIDTSALVFSDIVDFSDAYRGPFSETGGGPPGSDGRLLDLQATWAKIDALIPLVEASLPEDGKPPPELEPIRPPFETREPWFVIRCVYERPNCGPFHPAVVSEPTQPFQLASFFDSDAPQRPIRIPMPLDISPAGLRKYKKNATLMFSDMLCGKVSKIKKLTFADLVLSVLPWPFHKNLPNVGKPGPCKGSGGNFGMWCSLSIPIVTLCALILLIIMVALFDIFFKWIPFLFLCLPILGMKGKKK